MELSERQNREDGIYNDGYRNGFNAALEEAAVRAREIYLTGAGAAEICAAIRALQR
jgi:hypothetical protein